MCFDFTCGAFPAYFIACFISVSSFTSKLIITLLKPKNGGRIDRYYRLASCAFTMAIMSTSVCSKGSP